MKKVWGVIASYDEPEELLEVIKKARKEGYTKLDTFTPIPIHGLDEALGLKKTKLGWVILLAGLIGGVGGFFMQWYANVIHWPWNIGGKPFNSWPMFIPVAFELTVLCAGLTAVIGMFIANGLPEPYHPAFNVEAFEDASRDKFFISIEATDPKFDSNKVESFLKQTSKNVYEVEE